MKRTVPGMFGLVLLTAAALAVFGRGGALAAGPYDGTYHGRLTGVGMNAVTCAKSAAAQITVTDNKLEYHHMGNALIPATVAADGSFSGSAMNQYASRRAPEVQTLDGKITGGHIQAETKVGNKCTYALDLKKF